MKKAFELPKETIILTVDLGKNPDETMNKILNLIVLISCFERDNFPNDDYWKNNLPQWMVENLATLSEEECTLLLSKTPKHLWDTLPWEFGSWLDAIRDRGWEFYDFIRDNEVMHILLISTDIPERLDAFKQIIIAAGGKVLRDSIIG